MRIVLANAAQAEEEDCFICDAPVLVSPDGHRLELQLEDQDPGDPALWLCAECVAKGETLVFARVQSLLCKLALLTVRDEDAAGCQIDNNAKDWALRAAPGELRQWSGSRVSLN